MMRLKVLPIFLMLGTFLVACGTVTVSVGPQAGGSSGSVSVSSSDNSGPGNNSNNSGATTGQRGVRTKTSGCVAQNGLPDSACTPGDVLNVTANDICQSGYAKRVRDVSTAEKDAVYAEYGILSHTTGEYEVDHLVSLELGGSNDISNLWPEAAAPRPGFHEKDKVENYLHDQVCSGALTLQQAQQEIATNWFAVYQQIAR